MNIFCDIDGTLTTDGKKANSKIIINRIAKLKELSESHIIYLWSARGYDYVYDFAYNNGLGACVRLCVKPDLIIDDNPTIRPNWDKKIETPEYLDE